MPAPRKKEMDRDVRVIDAAYGLVLGAFDGLLGDDDRGYAEFQKPEVQAAAMEAAESFFAKLKL